MFMYMLEVKIVYVTPAQFDTNPQGTIKLLLSDDFSDEAFNVADLPYCKGNISCKYLDPWDLNWPLGILQCGVSFAASQSKHVHGYTCMEDYVLL